VPIAAPVASRAPPTMSAHHSPLRQLAAAAAAAAAAAVEGEVNGSDSDEDI
jgi:hypothetical protein